MKPLALALIVWLALTLPCAASTYIANTSSQVAGSGNANNAIPVPTGIVNGDTLLFCFKLDSTTVTTLGGTFTSCTNFASLIDVTDGTLDMKCGCRVASSEPASYTPTWTGNAVSAGEMIDIKSTDGSTPAIDLTPVGTNAGRNPAQITTVTNNDLILSLITNNCANGSTVASGQTPLAFSRNTQSTAVLYGSQTIAGTTTWMPTSMGMSGAGVALELTVAVKSNTTTAASFVGLGAESNNSGSAANVSPRIAANGAAGDVLFASVAEGTNTGIAITPATGAGTYTAAGVTYSVATLITGDSHTAVTFNQASNAGVNMTLPPDLGLTVLGTEECWVKFTGSSWDGTIMLMGTGSTGWGVGVGNTTTGNLGTNFLAMVQNSSFTKPTSSPSIVAGTVYHVVGENDTAAFKVWINNTSYNVTDHGGAVPTVNANIGGTTVYSPISATQQKCAFYNYELSAAQIANHYLAGTTAPAGYAGAGVTGGATYDAVIQNDGPDIYWNLGESSGTNAASIGQIGGNTWTQIGSAIVDPTSVTSLSTYTATAIGGHGAAQFNFASNPANSNGLITDWGNLNTTTPCDANATLATGGMANSMTPSITPTAADELLFYATVPSYGFNTTIFAAIALGRIGLGYGPLSSAAAHNSTTGGNVSPFVVLACGLKAATTPTRTTAHALTNFEALELFTSTLPSSGSWFF